MSGNGPGPRTIAVLTTGRQDWGILRSACAAIRDQPGLALSLAAGGMSLSAAHGHTVDALVADGFAPDARLAWLPEDPAAPLPAPEAQAAGALTAVGAWLRATRPDALLLVGDRLETAAAALAATLAGVPIVHLHGGEQTLGAFDDALRHAITKLAHLHLVSHEEHALRVIAMGEDPASVHVVGAPGLDNLGRADLPGREALAVRLGIPLTAPVVVVTVHPATLAADPTATATAVAEAMRAVPATYVVTLPNTDPGGDSVAATMRAAAEATGGAAVAALGERGYWALLRVADAMLGNSSSGVIEAPVLDLPVVNVGDRQAGRRRDANVIDVADDAAAIAGALRRALDPGFRPGLPAADARLADGRAGERVARIIAAWQPPTPPRKPPIRMAT
ncbi:MAG TPA: UDP-N-acetylglucosamine 2-epimerase [Candidatus Limnocylindrales bacterium]|nr:UDP-N-acetylglucosamine 2-epimerase [Candidatus Limnocylindrales bacterium]